MSSKIIVIGAGVVGAASALALQKSGHDVILVDRSEPCSGASFGNAGAIVNGSCLPTATPDILSDVASMITQKHSPLFIKPSYLHRIFPWLVRFVLQGRTTKFNQNAFDLHALSKNAVDSWQLLTDKNELSKLFKDTGWLKVYESENTFNKTARSREMFDKMGTKYELLDSDAIRDLEPNLAPIYKHGFYQKDCLSVTNPQKLVEGMVKLLVTQGGQYQKFDVAEIKTNGDKVYLNGINGSINADKVVVASGAWSRNLAKQMGDNIPLDTERGYHIMLPSLGADLLNRPVVNAEYSFVLSPMETGLRMTSQVELAGLNAKPNYDRIRRLLPLAKSMLPELELREESVWMGFRPSLPDSLPVIGFSSRSNKVFYAFGHQHLGMTLAAVTGFMVADMLNGKTSEIDACPYRPTRFNRW
ncbi:MAG: FAD-dependent oxidoreductase [Kangiella sp.]|nr:MAG: FAD-dependent oxidoreductase [Kangiella sp.]